MQPGASTYTELTGAAEDRRLNAQNQALRSFDEDVYRRTLASYEAPRILDIGCGNGDMISDLISDIPNCTLFGIDCMERQIALATERHPQGSFRLMDVEEDSFADDLRAWMGSSGTDAFDIINCSMVLLHLRDPASALGKLRPFLAEGGTLIVRDVDDGLQLAYPDPEGRFKKIFAIFENDTSMGDRHCGRKVPSYLKEAGFGRIRLEKEGLSNLEVPDKMLLYEMALPTFLNNMKARALANPSSIPCRENYEWFAGNIDAMRSCFMQDGFFFSVGFVTFTAM